MIVYFIKNSNVCFKLKNKTILTHKIIKISIYIGFLYNHLGKYW